MNIRLATREDQPWLAENDEHVEECWIERSLLNDEYIVAERENNLVGFLRYSLFWGKIPYMDMIWVEPSHRRAGIGRALFAFWERRMADANASVLMTSSMSDEIEPQEWHKKNGFHKSGQLTFGDFQETPEIFFIKELSK